MEWSNSQSHPFRNSNLYLFAYHQHYGCLLLLKGMLILSQRVGFEMNCAVWEIAACNEAYIRTHARAHTYCLQRFLNLFFNMLSVFHVAQAVKAGIFKLQRLLLYIDYQLLKEKNKGGLFTIEKHHIMRNYLIGLKIKQINVYQRTISCT